MQSSILFGTLALAVFLVAIYPSSSEAWVIDRAVRSRESNCKPCTDPEDCNHYVICKPNEIPEMDECGRKYCAKGPDDRCGGRKGKCAKGLLCTGCGYCGGCASKTMECSQFAYDCLLPSPF